MSAKNTEGPAFPIIGEPFKIQDSGMTLRDYFAAKAMAGVWACGGNMDGMQEKIAEAAYRQADAMITAREGGE